jgi:fumarate reductase iron-sulfur subunit
LRDYYPKPVVIEPLANFPVIRDLVIDMEDFMAKLKAVKPWIIRQLGDQPLGDGPFRQTPNQVEHYRQFSQCINCMCCYAACPVYAMEPEFIGPAAIALARRDELDSRDQGHGERSPVILSSEGIWECTFVGECSAACPKGVDPAKAIQQTKFDSTNEWLMQTFLPWGTGDGSR